MAEESTPAGETRAMVSDEQIRFWISQTENTLLTLLEAGLGREVSHGKSLESCFELIRNARLMVIDDRVEDAAKTMSEADAILHRVYWEKSTFWRFRRHAPLEFLYLAGIMLLVLGASTSWRPAVLEGIPKLDGEVWGVPAAVLAWGALGAVLRSLYWLHLQVGRRIYRSYFSLTHLCAPLIGALFGALAYLLLRAGLLTMGGGAAEEAQNQIFPSAVALLFGFNWEPLLDWVKNLRVPSKRSDDRSASPKKAPPVVKNENGETESGVGETANADNDENES